MTDVASVLAILGGVVTAILSLTAWLVKQQFEQSIKNNSRLIDHLEKRAAEDAHERNAFRSSIDRNTRALEQLAEAAACNYKGK